MYGNEKRWAKGPPLPKPDEYEPMKAVRSNYSSLKLLFAKEEIQDFYSVGRK